MKDIEQHIRESILGDHDLNGIEKKFKNHY